MIESTGRYLPHFYCPNPDAFVVFLLRRIHSFTYEFLSARKIEFFICLSVLDAVIFFHLLLYYCILLVDSNYLWSLGCIIDLIFPSRTSRMSLEVPLSLINLSLYKQSSKTIDNSSGSIGLLAARFTTLVYY